MQLECTDERAVTTVVVVQVVEGKVKVGCASDADTKKLAAGSRWSLHGALTLFGQQPLPEETRLPYRYY